MNDRAESLADQVTQLRRELSLAEEGLAKATQEIKELKDRLAKIAAFDPGKFRPLEDEITIWKLATGSEP